MTSAQKCFAGICYKNTDTLCYSKYQVTRLLTSSNFHEFSNTLVIFVWSDLICCKRKCTSGLLVFESRVKENELLKYYLMSQRFLFFFVHHYPYFPKSVCSAFREKKSSKRMKWLMAVHIFKDNDKKWGISWHELWSEFSLNHVKNQLIKMKC